MTKAEVAVLLRNQRVARARGEEPRPDHIGTVHEGNTQVSVFVADWSDVAQLTLVKPAGLPRAASMTLPLPPSWNRVFKARAVPVGRGRWTAQVYKSKEAKDYSAAVGSALRRQAWPGPFERDVMLRVSGDVVMARAGCDLDDRFKVLLDALQGHVYVNDEQVAEFGRVRRLVDSSNPHVRLTFEPIAVDRYGKATE